MTATIFIPNHYKAQRTSIEDITQVTIVRNNEIQRPPDHGIDPVRVLCYINTNHIRLTDRNVLWFGGEVKVSSADRDYVLSML